MRASRLRAAPSAVNRRRVLSAPPHHRQRGRITVRAVHTYPGAARPRMETANNTAQMTKKQA